MRVLQLHCDSIEYTATAREIESAEEGGAGTARLENVLAALIAVEAGDDAGTARRAADDISSLAARIGCPRVLVYPYAHLSASLAPPRDALALLRLVESGIRADEVSHAPFGWTKSYAVRVKAHPLAESLRVFGPGDGGDGQGGAEPAALGSESRLESTWHVLTPDGTLHDAASFDFGKCPALRRLYAHEESGTRRADDAPAHVSLMRRMGIADYEPASDSGNMRFLPNGRLIKSLIERHVGERVRAYGASEVETPIMYDSAHPSMKSYFDRFPARQYNIDSEGRRFFLRFAACFGQFLIAAQAQLSHHNLPYRLYELTRYSFRREQSGELVGLRRLRAFTMPDCHAFCEDMAQAVSELGTRFELSRSVMDEIGLRPGDYEMSVRMTREFYEGNGGAVARLAALHGRPVLVEMWRERFFYFVLKWEFNYVDAAGKASALSTDQIDVENGERYGIEFAGADGAMRHPIILHNSPCGAVERVIYALLENAARDSAAGSKPSLPLWLSPTQARIVPVSPAHHARAAAVADELAAAGVRVDIDDRSESVGKRIRQAEREWVHHVAVIGDDEAASGSLSVRSRASGKTESMAVGDLARSIAEGTGGMPRSPPNMPRLLSERAQLMV